MELLLAIVPMLDILPYTGFDTCKVTSMEGRVPAPFGDCLGLKPGREARMLSDPHYARTSRQHPQLQT